MVYLVEFHEITKILLTLREITKKITKNFQLPKKSEKSRNITKSNLNYQIWSHCTRCSSNCPTWSSSTKFGIFNNSARIVTETLSGEVNIIALFTDNEVNNYFSMYHFKTKMTKKQWKYFKYKTICISAPVTVVNTTVFTRF